MATAHAAHDRRARRGEGAPALGLPRAKFSGPFTVAIALLGGGGLGVSLEDFTDERARDPELLALADRVKCVADADCDAIFPHALPAVVQVRLKDGSMREQRVMENRGGPGRPAQRGRAAAEVLIERARPAG